MDFETFKVIAALSGFFLGLLNLGLTIYNNYIKKAKLNINIDKATIRCINEGDYDFQVNLTLSSKNGPSYIKNIFIEHPTNCIGEYSNSNRISANRALTFITSDLLSETPDGYKARVTELFKNPIPVRDLKINDHEHRSITITDRIVTTREPDGYEDFPVNDWKLYVNYNNETISADIIWNCHKNGSDRHWKR